MHLVEAAADQRRRLIEQAPRVAVICGPASAEDKTYFEATPPPARSQHGLAGALTRLGATCVRLIEIAESAEWLTNLNDIDLAFVTLHGNPGTVGTIQGWLRLP